MKTESTLVVLRVWEGEKEKPQLKGYRVSFWGDENVLELDSGEDCITLWMYLMPLDCMYPLKQPRSGWGLGEVRERERFFIHFSLLTLISLPQWVEGDTDIRSFQQKPLAPMTAVRSKWSRNWRPRETAQALFRSWKLCSYEIHTDGSVGDDLGSFIFTFL